MKRTILHADHAMSEQIRTYVLDTAEKVKYRDAVKQHNSPEQPLVGFFIYTFDLPEGIDGTVPCALYGPLMGDTAASLDALAFYGKRGERTNLSRQVNKPMRPSRKVTIIGSVVDKAKDGTALDAPEMIVYTMFGGPLAPKEPTDPTLEAAKAPESFAFWAAHALATG